MSRGRHASFARRRWMAVMVLVAIALAAIVLGSVLEHWSRIHTFSTGI